MPQRQIQDDIGPPPSAERSGRAALGLPPPFAGWFASRNWTPRAHQLAMLDKARAGRDALLVAPTGGGKTLAGFLPSLVELAARPASAPPGELHTLYISPLKALAVDVERNLTAPIREMGLNVTAESRTGDTGQARRDRQRLQAPDILLTTPEQLALFCAWEGARRYFRGLRAIVIDEVHALAPSKRGDLLTLGLARLRALAPEARISGLSATVADPARLRRWLSDRGEDVVIGEAGARPVVEVLLSGNRVPWAGHTARHAMDEIYEAVRAARTTLIFVNTRWQAEHAFQELWRRNTDNLPIALHHGSLSAEQRRQIEATMARGELRAVVCTSTLDLGIDWGAVDLVVQLAAPKGAARLTQRIGRANHRLGEPSRALLVPASRFEMLECRAAADAVADGALDDEPARDGALDVLAQHVMGCACSEPFDEHALYDEVRRAAPYAGLTRADFRRVIDLVATGGYALRNYDRFRRIVQDRAGPGLWRPANIQAVRRHRMNVGAIASAQTVSVRVAGRRGPGRRIGEAEESFFAQLAPGDTFLFGGAVWRFEMLRDLSAIVTPSSDPEPKAPGWGGTKMPISTYLAARVRRMIGEPERWAALPGDVREWLAAQHDRSALPGLDDLLVETFPRGGRHFLVCYPFEGRLAHATLAMLLTRRLERAGAGPVGYVENDYAVCIWTMRPMAGLDFDELFKQDMLGDDLEEWLQESFMMKRAFRECALIAGMIERRFPGHEKSGRQVTFSSDLIYDTLRRHEPDHILLDCARADAARRLLDSGRLGGLLARVQGRILARRLDRVSPFAAPMLMEIGRERAPGSAAAEMMLEDAAGLAAEAMA